MTFIIQSQSYRVDHKKAQMQGWISKESIKHTPSPLCSRLSVSTAYVGLPRLQTERQGGKMEWKWEEGGKSSGCGPMPGFRNT
uniref:Uncharacterized protein n=1 Tax=Oreochromis aureus TaxID=47969 RepID=A0A668VCM7_OREAU